MADLSINNNVKTYSTTSTESTKATEKQTAVSKTAENTSKVSAAKDDGVVYEKSKAVKKDSANQIYNRDSIVAKLKADQAARAASMQSLVEKILGKQVSKSFAGGKQQADMFDLTGLSDSQIGGLKLADIFRDAASKASPEDIAKAQADVADDGYWGVEQTSDRLVSMAIALSGGDTDKADKMMDAIQKGFDKATAAWGEKLPQISQDTLKATMDKMNDWKNGVTTAENYNKYMI